MMLIKICKQFEKGLGPSQSSYQDFYTKQIDELSLLTTHVKTGGRKTSGGIKTTGAGTTRNLKPEDLSKVKSAIDEIGRAKNFSKEQWTEELLDGQKGLKGKTLKMDELTKYDRDYSEIMAKHKVGSIEYEIARAKRSVVRGEFDSNMARMFGSEYKNSEKFSAYVRDVKNYFTGDGLVRSIRRAAEKDSIGVEAYMRRFSGAAVRGYFGFLAGDVLGAVGVTAFPHVAKFATKKSYKDLALGKIDDIQDAFTKRLESVPSDFVTGKVSVGIKRGVRSSLATYNTKKSKEENYNHIKEQIVNNIEDQDQFVDKVRQATSFTNTIFPEVATSMAGRAQVATAYLHENLIVQPDIGSIINPSSKKPSDMELNKFDKVYQAVVDPMSVFEDFAKGVVTRDQVRALRAVYPELHSDLVTEVVSYIADKKSFLPYNKKIQLATLMEMPFDTTLQPRKVQNFQMSFSREEQEQPVNQHGGARPHNYKASGTKQSQTRTQQIEQNREKK